MCILCRPRSLGTLARRRSLPQPVPSTESALTVLPPSHTTAPVPPKRQRQPRSSPARALLLRWVRASPCASRSRTRRPTRRSTSTVPGQRPSATATRPSPPGRWPRTGPTTSSMTAHITSLLATWTRIRPIHSPRPPKMGLWPKLTKESWTASPQARKSTRTPSAISSSARPQSPPTRRVTR